MGGTITGKYHFSPCAYKWNIQRNVLLNFVEAVMDRYVCLITPNPPDFDPELLYRPFTTEVWASIFIILSLGVCFIFIHYFFFNNYNENKTSIQIIMMSFWFLFVLINAFYGGTLTMFFVAELTVPFNSLRDVLKAFPTWKLVMKAGNDIKYKEPALSVSGYQINMGSGHNY